MRESHQSLSYIIDCFRLTRNLRAFSALNEPTDLYDILILMTNTKLDGATSRK